MKKFNMDELKPMSTPMSTSTSLDLDENGEAVDQREYRSMIGSLLYLTVTRSDIQFTMCLCARFQASTCSSHRMAVQQIFSYLKHTPKFGIWYSTSSSLDLVGFSILILQGVGLTERALLVLATFSDLLLFAGLLENSLLFSIHHRGLVCSCCSQILWIVHTMRDFGVIFAIVPIMCDNTSAISIAKNPVFHKRMRHFERRHHFLRDHVEK
jgi:hypothetical protein